MKKVICLFIITITLCACAPRGNNSSNSVSSSSAASSPQSSAQEELPRIDGSTANIPMASLMLQRYFKMSLDDANKLTKFSKTSDAYLNLLYYETDILLVYEADESIKKQLEDSIVEFEYYPIGRDALVFITNETNPVKNLTTKQIQDIYQDKITNWKNVGGEDKKIAAYQRPETSGSQALMQKLMMKDLKLAKAPVEFYVAEMEGLLEKLANYNNSGNAIGYSVYYYAKNMYQKPGLGFISVDGIMPSNETIASKEYAYTNEFYAVIRKKEPEGSATRKFLEWILSEDGKKCIADAGYVGI